MRRNTDYDSASGAALRVYEGPQQRLGETISDEIQVARMARNGDTVANDPGNFPALFVMCNQCLTLCILPKGDRY